jgi:hypothetical protein
MRRRTVSVLVTVLLAALAFWGGVRWEHNNCRIDWPNKLDQVDQSVVCEGFRSDLPPVPNPTIAP